MMNVVTTPRELFTIRLVLYSRSVNESSKASFGEGEKFWTFSQLEMQQSYFLGSAASPTSLYLTALA